jgi:predicted permease
VIFATLLKLFVMPLIAWALAEFVFRLAPHDVLVVTVLAALPTAQNVFNYSQRYGVGEAISRDTVFLTTIGCVPVLIAIMLLLG